MRSYHHGDLRAALIAEGLALLGEQGADGLSLREVARRAGVSATAVYRHFPDKAALLRALAREGLARLAAAQRAASERAGGGIAGFNATGAAYVRFALANAGLFRLLMTHPKPPDFDPADYVLDGDDPMAMLQASAAALAPPGIEPRLFALQCWSLAHGLAVLLLDGQVPADDAVIDRVIDLATFRAQ